MAIVVNRRATNSSAVLGVRSTDRPLADLPSAVEELKVEAAGRPHLGLVRAERRAVGRPMLAVVHHLVDAGHYWVPLRRDDFRMRGGPFVVVVVDIAVAGGATGEAAWLTGAPLLDP